MRAAFLLATTLAGVAAVTVAGSAGCGGGDARAKNEGTKILPRSAAVSFKPGTDVFVFGTGGHLQLGRIGDNRHLVLTRQPEPAAGARAKKRAPTKKQTKKCIPLPAGAAHGAPQGSWHGQPSWSPDGRFIAFVARWDDKDCRSGNDGDWDIWVVALPAVDPFAAPHTVVEKAARWGKRGDKKGRMSVQYVAGPLRYFQITRAAGAEMRPTWAGPRRLAYQKTGGAVYVVSLPASVR